MGLEEKKPDKLDLPPNYHEIVNPPSNDHQPLQVNIPPTYFEATNEDYSAVPGYPIEQHEDVIANPSRGGYPNQVPPVETTSVEVTADPVITNCKGCDWDKGNCNRKIEVRYTLSGERVVVRKSNGNSQRQCRLFQLIFILVGTIILILAFATIPLVDQSVFSWPHFYVMLPVGIILMNCIFWYCLVTEVKARHRHTCEEKKGESIWCY